MNPVDDARRKEKAKELKRNRELRKAHREEALQRMTVAELNDEIVRITRLGQLQQSAPPAFPPHLDSPHIERLLLTRVCGVATACRSDGAGRCAPVGQEEEAGGGAAGDAQAGAGRHRHGLHRRTPPLTAAHPLPVRSALCPRGLQERREVEKKRATEQPVLVKGLDKILGKAADEEKQDGEEEKDSGHSATADIDGSEKGASAGGPAKPLPEHIVDAATNLRVWLEEPPGLRKPPYMPEVCTSTRTAAHTPLATPRLTRLSTPCACAGVQRRAWAWPCHVEGASHRPLLPAHTSAPIAVRHGHATVPIPWPATRLSSPSTRSSTPSSPTLLPPPHPAASTSPPPRPPVLPRPLLCHPPRHRPP